MRFSALETYAAAVAETFSVTPEAQNGEYESGVAQIHGGSWHVRTARITPTKPGAFLAFWRRDAEGKTAPFGREDAGAGLLVFVEENGRRGVFRFTAAHLDELGITSGTRPGKRGFRVYPPWCEGLNPQATRSRRAQASAFREY